ncbi:MULTISPECIES: cellulase family glycosylhydrolase [unclassified Luteococcus]|uniref:cellulase family glycosylhydrolase n=1 Tax=unclassified Luteococcus TaxID=2639923 RepID=UPI00313B0C21
MRARRNLVAALAVALTATGPLAWGAEPQPVPSPSPVERPHTTGRWIVDAQGRVLLPVGTNVMNKDGDYLPESIGFGDDDAAFLAEQGFTSVRLGFSWRGVEPNPGQYDRAYLAALKQTIATFHRHGVSVLLDSHQDMVAPAFEGNGFPDWAALTDGWPNTIKAGFPNNQFFNVALQHVYDNLHANKPGPGGVGLADRYAAMWAEVARTVRDSPGVIGFDLYNEPWPGTNWVGCLTPGPCQRKDADLSSFQQKATQAIRATGDPTPVFAEPFSLFNQGSQTNLRVNGTNVGLSFHVYCPMQQMNGPYGNCLPQDKRVFANAESRSTALAQPSLLTEFGNTKDATTLRTQSDLAMRNRMGWYYWEYSRGEARNTIVADMSKPPEGNNVDWGKLDHLVVMRPEAVAGIPQEYSYDRDRGVFRLTWSTELADGGRAAAGAITTISVPRRTAPQGYTVSVQGARVTSPAGADVVTLAQEAGAHSGQVTITRR